MSSKVSVQAKSDKLPKRDRLLWARILYESTRQALFWIVICFIGDEEVIEKRLKHLGLWDIQGLHPKSKVLFKGLGLTLTLPLTQKTKLDLTKYHRG